MRLLARHPHDRDTLGALRAYAQQQGNLRQDLRSALQQVPKLKAELEAGLRRDASDFDPRRVLRTRK